MLSDLFETESQRDARLRHLDESASVAGYCARVARSAADDEVKRLRKRVADLESVNRDLSTRLAALESQRD
jgi:hypothetical protein